MSQSSAVSLHARIAGAPGENARLCDALRRPLGQYGVRRAAALAGVPQRTVYAWAQGGVLVPDYPGRPLQWSYRDLVYLRLVGWLRGKSMPRSEVAVRVRKIRTFLESPTAETTELRSDGVGMLIGDESIDRLSGQAVLDGMLAYFDVFDLAAPADLGELGRGRVWGPNLVQPSEHTSIFPQVMTGEPCIRGTRIPTATIYALRTGRALGASQLVQLYLGLDIAEISDAVTLEHRLQRAA